MSDEKYSGLSAHEKDPFMRSLNKVIRWGVKILALLMVAIILWGKFES